VTMTVQEALEKLVDRKAGKPRIVHDHGSQFVSREWQDFVMGTGVTDIKTRHVLAEVGNSAFRVQRSAGATSQDSQRRGVDRGNTDRLLFSVRRYGKLPIMPTHTKLMYHKYVIW
jgi:transposase InsO family protein